MGMTVDLSQLKRGIAALIAQTRQNELTALQQIADHVSGAAKDRAPIDAGNLTGDISGTVQSDPATGQKGAVISVPLNANSKYYAIPMHEHTYNLGKLSQGKQERNGVTVGNGYIRRAMDDSRDDIRAIIQDNLKKGM